MPIFFMFFYDRHPAAIKQLLCVIVKRDGNTGLVLYILVHRCYFRIFHNMDVVSASAATTTPALHTLCTTTIDTVTLPRREK